MDAFSKTDPICVLYIKNPTKANIWEKHSQTEKVNNNNNPDFIKDFKVKYFFEKRHDLKFSLIDDDRHGKFELVGEIEMSMS